VERLDWKLTLSLQFSWRTKKAGRGQKRCPLFKRKEKDQRIILINNSFKGQRAAPDRVAPAPRDPTPLFTFLNRKEISAAASFSWLEVLLCCHKQIPKDARVAPHAESSTGILTCFPFAESRHLTSPKAQSLSFSKCLTPRLGSTNSQLIAIFEITLFSSVEKGFHFSNYYCYQDLHHWFFEPASQRACRKTNASFYSFRRTACTEWHGISLRF